ncbi:MAG TPA: amidohydrolase family protein [Stellaceae bacterium]|jgi:N-acyl-D-aspartate/D-glutamate deacylase|nr:amidohydrolase family protein [Stellaceae bacterium]
MAYDVLIKNGLVIDGSGMPGFRGDVAIKDGKIAEIGKLSGAAGQTVDVGGQVIAPGFIDNHCHYDAQVTWDPLCTFSCDHGATSVVIGNCSLSLAPVRRGKEKRMAEFLSYVEAIPMEVLSTVEVDWESFPQYMERLDSNLGVNVGTLMGHTAIRYYVMDEDCQNRAATDDELKQMQQLVRDGMEAGALGLSVSRNKGHYDPQGVHIPALWADEKEIFALADVLRDMSTGIIQSGGGREAEMDSGLMARLAEATGRPVVYNNLGQSVRRPGQWKTHMDRVNETVSKGIRAYPLCSPNRTTQTFNMSNSQLWRGSPTWHPILLASDEEKLKAYADPAVRKKLHEEMVEGTVVIPGGTIAKDWWNYIWVHEPVLEKNKWMIEKSLKEVADAQGKGIIDSFLDLVVEEKLETTFMQAENNVEEEAMRAILTYPNALIGLSDGGAHVQFHGGYGFSTRLLSEWVREKKAMTLEAAVRRLTFDSASTFGLYDRGLLRPGMKADITVFDPTTVKPLPEFVVHDFPAGGWRFKEPAQGIYCTFVNGQMLMKEGEHTGNLPGRVLRNSHYTANHA